MLPWEPGNPGVAENEPRFPEAQIWTANDPPLKQNADGSHLSSLVRPSVFPNGAPPRPPAPWPLPARTASESNQRTHPLPNPCGAQPLTRTPPPPEEPVPLQRQPKHELRRGWLDEAGLLLRQECLCDPELVRRARKRGAGDQEGDPGVERRRGGAAERGGGAALGRRPGQDGDDAVLYARPRGERPRARGRRASSNSMPDARPPANAMPYSRSGRRPSAHAVLDPQTRLLWPRRRCRHPLSSADAVLYAWARCRPLARAVPYA